MLSSFFFPFSFAFQLVAHAFLMACSPSFRSGKAIGFVGVMIAHPLRKPLACDATIHDM